MHHLIFLITVILLSGCCSYKKYRDDLSSIQIIDRNGFKETISSSSRLSYYKHADFLSSQPYAKVMRTYSKNDQGKVSSKITSYHNNGEIWQYLEVVNGRAHGRYREWHENGVLRIELLVIEGIGDLEEDVKLSWVFDGVSKVWDEQGNLMAEIHYDKGKLSGKSFYYYKNGKVRKVIPNKDDRVNGEVVYYNKKEEVVGSERYLDGIRDGVSTYNGDEDYPPFSEKHESGLLMEAVYYGFSGEIICKIAGGIGSKANFKNGKLFSIEEYKNGVVEGKIQKFDQKERLKNVFHIKDGVRDGDEWIFYPAYEIDSQKVKIYIQWNKDVVQGITRSWYENGRLESEREICNNKKHGISSSWYIDGSIMMVEEYEKDRLKKGTYMKKGDSTPVSYVENGKGTVTIYDSNGCFIESIKYKDGIPTDEY